jgi:NAD(P)H-flavin reductase
MGYKDQQIYLSMEKNMSCGLGKCGHCMLGEYFVCKDGPVFTYDELKFTPDIWK